MIRALVLAAAMAIMAGAAARAAPLEAYGQLPDIEQVAISPDGARLAVLIGGGEERRILIRELNGGGEKLMSVGDIKIRHLKWAGPDDLLIASSTTARVAFVLSARREYLMLAAYNRHTGKVQRLMRDAENGLNVITSLPEVRMIDGKPVVLVTGIHFVSQIGRQALYRIELKYGRSKLVHPGFDGAYDWVVDAGGEPAAQATMNDATGRWALRVKRGVAWPEVKVIETGQERPTLLGLGRDGRSVLIAARQGEQSVLRELSTETGAMGEPLGDADGEGLVFDPVSHKLIGVGALVGDEDRLSFFAPEDQRVWTAIVKAYPGQGVRLVSWTDDRRRVVVKVDSPTEGPAYAYVDLATKKASWIGGLYQKLKPQDISPVRPVRFKAADGMDLNGYLTLPRDRPEKGLPLVVLPHGGPAVRDRPGFDWWAQALASRGYAVLQVNYRGSDGYGWKFLSAGFGEWGRKMQTDLSDGVRHLADQGVIDPKRVCIVGASYGGYAALAGATLDRGVYRCAASVAGVSDLKRMVAWSRTQNGRTAQRYWIRFMGAEDPNDPILVARSPAAKAEGVTTPILLIHGRDDTVVPLEQSQIMQKALTAAGQDAELTIMDGEDHWLSRGDTRLLMLNAVTAFLEKNNPPS